MKKKRMIFILCGLVVVVLIYLLFQPSRKSSRRATVPDVAEPPFTDIYVGFTVAGKSRGKIPHPLRLFLKPDCSWNVITGYISGWCNALWFQEGRCLNVKYYHTLIIAKNPHNGPDFHVRAGGSSGFSHYSSQSSSSSSSSSSACQHENLLCATAEDYTERSTDWPPGFRQHVGRIWLPFKLVKNKMRELASELNERNIPYTPFRFKSKKIDNSNTFASDVLRYFHIKPSIIREQVPKGRPYMSVPGWKNESGKKDGVLDILPGDCQHR